MGLLENVRVRRAGYAFRQSYNEFKTRYKMLSKETWPSSKHSSKSGMVMKFKGSEPNIEIKIRPRIFILYLNKYFSWTDSCVGVFKSVFEPFNGRLTYFNEFHYRRLEI